MERKDNKSGIPLEHYRTVYAETDPKTITARTGLAFDAEAGRFTLSLLKWTVFAYWPDFRLEPEEPADFPASLRKPSAQILFLRYLLEGVAAENNGRMLAYREVPWGDVYDANFQGRCIARVAYGFCTKLESFCKAAEALGGEKLTSGDASYEFAFLEQVKVRIILFAADEEFPPSAQFLFSSSAPFAFSAEDLAVVGDLLIDSLKEMSKR